MQETNYSPTGMRDIILQQEQRVVARFSNRNELVVLIKSTVDCTYENIIHTLDEKTLNDVQHYILTDVNKEELSYIK